MGLTELLAESTQRQLVLLRHRPSLLLRDELLLRFEQGELSAFLFDL